MPSTLQREGEPAAERKQAYDSREGDLWQSGLDSPTELASSLGLELNEDELKKRLVPWTSSAGRG